MTGGGWAGGLPAGLGAAVTAAAGAPADDTAARAALACLDLTSLNDDDDEAAIAALCARAVTPAGPVAAVCVYPRFAARAAQQLAGTGVRVAAVANFPDGGPDAGTAAAEAAEAVAAGADEIDVVFPHRAALAGDERQAASLLAACRRAIGPAVTLKVILETGLLPDAATITRFAALALDEGADFLKTSTGKRGPGASLEAVALLCGAIRDAGSPAGCKASGGIRTVAQAAAYLALVRAVLGGAAVRPARFRIGASSLLADILAMLGAGPLPRGSTGEPGY